MIGVLGTLDVGERDELMSEDVSSAESRIQSDFRPKAWRPNKTTTTATLLVFKCCPVGEL